MTHHTPSSSGTTGAAVAGAGAAYKHTSAGHHAPPSKPRSSSHSGPQDVTPEIVQDKRKTSDGRVVIRRYIKGKLLGKGGFARCYKFTSVEKNRVHAGKVVAKSSLTKSRAKQKVRTACC